MSVHLRPARLVWPPKRVREPIGGGPSDIRIAQWSLPLLRQATRISDEKTTRRLLCCFARDFDSRVRITRKTSDLHVNWNLNDQLLTATGGDYEFGNLGIFKIGDLAITATDAGSVALIHGEVALADLSMASVEGGDLVLLPEPGTTIGLFFGILGLAALKQARTIRKCSATIG